jgi:hypothetical protein
MSAVRPPEGANCSPSGGSAVARAASVGAHICAARPPEGANCSPSGGSAAARAASVGAHICAARPPVRLLPRRGEALPTPWASLGEAAQ